MLRGPICCSYGTVLFPTCRLRIAAHRVCFVQIEITVCEYYVGPFILSDNGRLKLPVGPFIVLT
jgi:hypothetical protein